jgi:hypothetical protein
MPDPNLLLHTIGAKTGQARSTSVVYFCDGGTYLIVASKVSRPIPVLVLTPR